MTSETPIPGAIGSPPRVFDIALAVVKQAGARKVLDCPAGEGPFSQYLIQAGLEVTACDIYPDQFAVSEIECVLGDMNGELPFDDGAFDAVVCLNGLQRVWARGQALKEIARVLIQSIEQPRRIIDKCLRVDETLDQPDAVGS